MKERKTMAKTSKKTAPATKTAHAPETLAIRSIPVDSVRAKDEADALGHVRALDAEVVEGLAASFRAWHGWGSIPPIVVTQDGDGGYTLVAGRHRLEAARIVGISAQCVVVDYHDAAGVRVKENLIRSELAFHDLIESLISIGDTDADHVLRASGKSRSWISKVSTVLKAVKAGLIQIDSCEGGLDASYRLAKTAGLQSQDGEPKARGGRPKKTAAPTAPPAPSREDDHDEEDGHDGETTPSPAPSPATPPGTGIERERRPIYAIYDRDDLDYVVTRLRTCGVPDTVLAELGLIDD